MTGSTRAMLPATPATLTSVLTQAEALPDGAEIQLAPGHYEGTWRVAGNIDLLGPEDGRESVVFRGDVSPVVTLADIGASLCRARVELTGSPEAADRWALAIDHGGTVVEVALAAPGGSALAVGPRASAIIDDLDIDEAARPGLPGREPGPGHGHTRTRHWPRGPSGAAGRSPGDLRHRHHRRRACRGGLPRGLSRARQRPGHARL